MLIIGLMDFLAVVTGAAADKEWLGRHLEGYVFVAMVLWVMLYTMSRYSKKLELRFQHRKYKLIRRSIMNKENNSKNIIEISESK